jgi:signal transduction histidine kinase
LEDVLVTDRLRVRRRLPNLQDEGRALRALARKMATAPDTLVDTLLEMALQLCHADSAGLSVLDTNSQKFIWTNLAGTLKQYLGGTTPRNFSPCGVCLDRDSPQLFSYPEKYFTYFGPAANPPFVEALVIPVYLRDQAPATIWILTHSKEVAFDTEDVRIMVELADFTSVALQLIQSAQNEKRARLKAELEIETRMQTEQAMRLAQNALEIEVDSRTAQLQELSTRLMTLQDDERRKIARELHDSTGQYLAAIGMNLSVIDREGSASPGHKVSTSLAMEAVERCTLEIRTLSYLLHPPLLDELGLRSALSFYVEGFSKRSGILVELDVPKNLGRFSSTIETALFRVVQQSLANIHRHSGTRTAEIQLREDAERIALLICDHGRGIPPDVITKINSGKQFVGVGIAGMRERIKGFGGRFNVRSSKNGTTVEVSLPVTQ